MLSHAILRDIHIGGKGETFRPVLPRQLIQQVTAVLSPAEIHEAVVLSLAAAVPERRFEVGLTLFPSWSSLEESWPCTLATLGAETE